MEEEKKSRKSRTRAPSRECERGEYRDKNLHHEAPNMHSLPREAGDTMDAAQDEGRVPSHTLQSLRGTRKMRAE